MKNPVNLTSIDLSRSPDTAKFFNNYYEILFDTASNEHDALLSFFENFTGSIESARVLASGVLYTAKKNNLDIMEVINEFSKLSKEQLNRSLALFLNYQRYQSSYLGINTSAPVSRYILRTIIY